MSNICFAMICRGNQEFQNCLQWIIHSGNHPKNFKKSIKSFLYWLIFFVFFNSFYSQVFRIIVLYLNTWHRGRNLMGSFTRIRYIFYFTSLEHQHLFLFLPSLSLASTISTLTMCIYISTAYSRVFP